MSRTLQEQIAYRARHTPDQPYLCQAEQGGWQTWAWSEAVREARHMAAALERLGLQPGDRVGLISRNCAHWILADLAIILAGMVSVPVYPTAGTGTVERILRHSGARACFVGRLEDPPVQLAGIPEELITIAFPYPGSRGRRDWETLIRGDAEGFPGAARAPSDTATLLYTSGSTGEPKGAVHTHAGFAFVGQRLARAIGVRPGDRVLSYLPLSHCTERAYVEAASFYAETTLYFAESLETFMDDLARARPTLFGSVPRLWKRFQLGVLQQVPEQRLERLLGIPLLGRLLRRRILRKLGLDAADWFASGSAPLARPLLDWWARLGVPIREGWGMTETFAYGTQTGRDAPHKPGTIGRPLPEAEMRVGEADELLIRCPCLMEGYYRDPERTAETIRDGFLHTGDRGSIDADGWVTITGRVKDLFKTTKGKYIAPVPIESRLARNALIEQVCVMGTGLTQPVAVIQLPEEARDDRAAVAATLQSTLEAVNRELEPHERLAGFLVASGTWDVDNGLITPTLKIRRDRIEQRYAERVAALTAAVEFEDSPVPETVGPA